MGDLEEKIVVFKAYDTVMRKASNLCQDQAGCLREFPASLTDENFVGLYPIRNEVFPGVRLHIFGNRFFDLVTETLAEIHSRKKLSLLPIHQY